MKHEARFPWMATDGKTFRGRCTCGWEGGNMTAKQAEKRTQRHIRDAARIAKAESQEG